MSTIVAVEKNGRTAVAWDTMTTVGSLRVTNCLDRTKVHRIGRSLVGVAGLSIYGNVLEHYFATKRAPALKDATAIFDFFIKFWRDLRERYPFVNDQWDDEDPTPFADLDAEFIVANRYGIFGVKEILSVSQFERFCAIGSGASHAEGALEVLYDQKGSAAEIAMRAVEVAISFDCKSGAPVEVAEVAAPKPRAKAKPRKRTRA